MAVKVYESIIENSPSLKAELCSGIGRLYLQVMCNCSQASSILFFSSLSFLFLVPGLSWNENFTRMKSM